jgi:hypothetical protein
MNSLDPSLARRGILITDLYDWSYWISRVYPGFESKTSDAHEGLSLEF